MADDRRLLHELEVHQVELELQNEALKAARLELEGALQRYTELFEFAPIAYLVVDPGGTIQDSNFAAARLLGIARGQLVGGPVGALASRSGAEAVEQLIEAVLSAGTSAGDREVALAHRPSGTVEVRVSGALLSGPSPTILLAVEDVTARRRAERALVEEGRRKDEFLASLSHELRNPLAPIRNGLAVLGRAPPGSDASRRALAILERQVGHLGRIVDDLLDVTRIARGKVRLHRERAELGALVHRTVEDHRSAFDAVGVALHVSLPRDPCWVEVDVTRIAQALGNLLGNAAKFTAHGGRVDVAVRREGGEATVTVRDTGVGIAPEVRDRLFEPFSQAPQTLDRSRGGLGLGLATVKGLVELHGGTVRLESEGPGHGTEFTLRIPLVEAPPERGTRGAAPASSGRRIVVIDDNADGAETLREILELGGHEVHVAADGPSGITLARAQRPDVVVCDIGLPGMDGYAVARAPGGSRDARHPPHRAERVRAAGRSAPRPRGRVRATPREARRPRGARRGAARRAPARDARRRGRCERASRSLAGGIASAWTSSPPAQERPGEGGGRVESPASADQAPA